mmetsp:Transcript_35/g.63  ORF Transcript_35/g.63 Transcript_35/m.63 type:complete len:356 (-) Transcript_35:137-1204(-)
MSDQGKPPDSNQPKPYRRIPGKAPLTREEPPVAKGPKCEEARDEDEPMYEPHETQTEERLSELFVTDDKLAYGQSRKAIVQQRFNNTATIIKEATKNSAEGPQKPLLTPLILTSSKNVYPFSEDAVTTAVRIELKELTHVEVAREFISVKAIGKTGPYVVALQGVYANALIAEGVLTVFDSNSDPPAVQDFTVKYFNQKPNPTDTPTTQGASSSADQEDMWSFSIFFNLPVEYTGCFDMRNELELPKQAINEAVISVFSPPAITHTIIQPKTELGYYRNTLRAIITMPTPKERPSDADALSKLKFVALRQGMRPATAVMTQETRSRFGVSNCCFRTTCKEDISEENRFGITGDSP